MNSLQEFKDDFAHEVHGMTVKEAHKKQICIDCKKPVKGRCYSNAGKREYLISGICELCFDSYFEKEEE